MKITQFTAFYPSRPFWAGSKVNFSDQSKEGWFHDQMMEEVFSQENDKYTIKICRDGMIMVRIEALEQVDGFQEHSQIEKTVKRWGEYLDYLNSFYLLLDSSTIGLARFHYFNLHEITNRDAFRIELEDGKPMVESIATESIASVFQLGRDPSSYRPWMPIENDLRITMRQVIPLDVIRHTADSFATVMAKPGLAKTLASFAKSLSEFKIGNYETSVVLSWFITEAALNRLWKNHVDSMNTGLAGDVKRINSARRNFLTGQDFTISMVSNLLELWDILPRTQFQEIDAVRGFRNKIVHSHDFVPGPTESILAMKTAQEMINRLWGLSLTPSFGYSVAGL